MTTQKVFGTDGIRGAIDSEVMNPTFITKLGWAVGNVISKQTRAKAVIGKDTRLSGYMLESAMQAGLASSGVNVLMLGPMPTPGIAYLTRSFHADLGVVISASHNTYQDNGIKFFTREGLKLPTELELEIEAQLEKSLHVVKTEKLGRAQRIEDARARYIEFCKSRIEHDIDLSSLNIVIDCAHGATYEVAPLVFSELGANTITLGCKPNGCNINDKCGATDTTELQQHVIENKADLGIALDGDGDRLIMVDDKGEVVDGDEILFILSKFYQQHGCLNGGVVGTQMSNHGLVQAMHALDIEFVRTHVGDRYVSAELLKRDWLLGGESSGHIICRDATTTGDGIISALKVLKIIHETGKTLHELKSEMTKFPQVLINVAIENPQQIAASASVQKATSEIEKQLGQRGRVLVRASGTEPIVRVMVECENHSDAKQYAEQLVAVVK